MALLFALLWVIAILILRGKPYPANVMHEFEFWLFGGFTAIFFSIPFFFKTRPDEKII